MANLTQNRNTRALALAGASYVDPVAAAVRIFKGAMVALDASGNAIPAAPTAAAMRGCALDDGADNSTGAAGAASVKTNKGVFLFNQTGLDRTDIETEVSVLDDNTVGGAGALKAGILKDITSEGAWVEIL
tara:strand:- start:872 stop:1264 length:393 start_codon:yes stop_codon:yes gene_type:complete